MDSVLRPRDIQTRIRSGESPEAVAAAAHTTVEKIMGFAAPVMAERAYIAEQAQKASVRRRAGNGPIGHLGDAVATRLAGESVDPDDLRWDAWRREDGRWTVIAELGAGEGVRRAVFSYDTAGRYVVAEDDEARAWVGERIPGASPEEPAAPEPAAPVADVAPVAPAPADPAPRDEQLALGDDTIAMVTGRPVDTPLEFDVEPLRAPASRPVTPAASTRTAPAAPTGDESLTEDLTETAAAVSAIAAVGGETADADWMATQASDRPAEPAVERLAPVEMLAPPVTPAPTATAATAAPAVTQEAAEAAPVEPVEPTPAPRKPAKGRGRASVPSWDEIMFGSTKPE